MNKRAQRLQMVRACIGGIIVMFFVLGFANSIGHYFLMQKLSNTFSLLATPVDSSKMIRALETTTLTSAQHHLLVTTIQGNSDSIVALRGVLTSTAKLSGKNSLSEAALWALAALFFFLFLRAEKRFRIASSEQSALTTKLIGH